MVELLKTKLKIGRKPRFKGVGVTLAKMLSRRSLRNGDPEDGLVKMMSITSGLDPIPTLTSPSSPLLLLATMVSKSELQNFRSCKKSPRT